MMPTRIARVCITGSIFLLSQHICAQVNQKRVDTKIEKATVFLHGAQINRAGKVSVGYGTTEIIFSGISPYINPQSIQLKAEGNFTVRSVMHKLNYLQELAKQAEIQKIDDQKESIQDEITNQNNMMSIYLNEETLLSKNQGIVSQNTGLKITDLKDAADFHRLRLIDLKQKETEVNKKLKKLTAELVKLTKQHDELNKQASTATSEIVVTVQSNETVNAGFSLAYFVDKAGWYPTYDIRVADIRHPITMVYKANVYQSSGEDWKDIKLTLSSANPRQNGEKPVLPAWYLHYFTPQNYGLNDRSGGNYNPNIREVSGRVIDKNGQPVSFATIKIKGTNTGASADANGYYRVSIPQNSTTLVFSAVGFQERELFVSSNTMNIMLQSNASELQEVVVTTAYGTKRSGKNESVDMSEASIPLTVAERESTTSFSFDIDMPYSILSDGKTSMVDMKTMEIPAQFEYYCIPKLDLDVFLTAKITDWANFNLLEGETNLFFEGTFLGKGLINPKASGDTLNISLGRDKNIAVKRQSIKEFSRKQLLGGNKTDYRTIEITVRNNKKQALNLILEDQYPLSTMKEVEVDKIENKEAELTTDSGKLTWTLQLEPAQEKKLTFRYSVKYPKNSVLVLD